MGSRLVTQVIDQQGNLFGWTPVCLAIGIAVYFNQKTEPAAGLCLALLALGLLT